MNSHADLQLGAAGIPGQPGSCICVWVLFREQPLLVEYDTSASAKTV